VPAGSSVGTSASVLPGLFASLARGLRSLAWLMDHNMDKPLALAATAAVLALLVYLSYRLSVGFYRNRDL
jgi:hypothetical protein